MSQAKPRLTERQVEREARRVLRRAAAGGSYIACLADGAEHGLFVAKNGWTRPVLHIASDIVSALKAREWLETDGRGALRLSVIGRAWLRRSLGTAEPFREQHRLDGTRYEAVDSSANTRLKVNLAETPLGWLRKRRGPDGRPLIGEAEFDAGERLRADFTAACLSPSVTSDWHRFQEAGRRGPSAGLDPTERALAARQRVDAALKSVGPGLSDILLETCCFLNGLESAERNLNWPQRSGKVVLQIALERLARHYGLVPAGGARRTSVWHQMPSHGENGGADTHRQG